MNRNQLLAKKLQLKQQLFKDQAAGRLALFLNYSMPSYSRQWFHTLIADKCQALYEGRIKKLMVFVPPQHGKSEIVSRKFPAWVLGQDPAHKIVGCSYSADLAEGFSRSIQLTIDSDEYQRVFTDTRLPSRGGGGLIRNVDYFDTTSRGFYKAVGVTGGDWYTCGSGYHRRPSKG